jgi:hypothetical protein
LVQLGHNGKVLGIIGTLHEQYLRILEILKFSNNVHDIVKIAPGNKDTPPRKTEN